MDRQTLLTKLALADAASCNCMTKTPDIQYHKDTCPHRVMREAYEYLSSLPSSVTDAAKDAELGRTAMRFVDRAGDVHPGIDDAERICAEFHSAMSDVVDKHCEARRRLHPTIQTMIADMNGEIEG